MFAWAVGRVITFEIAEIVRIAAAGIALFEGITLSWMQMYEEMLNGKGGYCVFFSQPSVRSRFPVISSENVLILSCCDVCGGLVSICVI